MLVALVLNVFLVRSTYASIKAVVDSTEKKCVVEEQYFRVITRKYNATSYGLVNKDSSLVYTEIIQSAPFLGVVQMINEVIYVWLSLYSTFVLYSMRGILRTKL